jgi:hypothetical protein
MIKASYSSTMLHCYYLIILKLLQVQETTFTVVMLLF